MDDRPHGLVGWRKARDDLVMREQWTTLVFHERKQARHILKAERDDQGDTLGRIGRSEIHPFERIGRDAAFEGDVRLSGRGGNRKRGQREKDRRDDGRRWLGEARKPQTDASGTRTGRARIAVFGTFYYAT